MRRAVAGLLVGSLLCLVGCVGPRYAGGQAEQTKRLSELLADNHQSGPVRFGDPQPTSVTWDRVTGVVGP